MKYNLINKCAKISAFVVVASMIASCTAKFEEYNTNPYGPTQEDMIGDNASTGSLIRSMIPALAQGQQNNSQMLDQMIGSEFGGEITCIAMWGNGGNYYTYNPRIGWYGNMFDTTMPQIYTGFFQIRKLSEGKGLAYQWAQILRVAASMRISDCYGAIPYSQISGSAFKNPDPNEYIPLLEETHCIKRWDAAPELPGAMQFGKYITSKGVLAAVGHTQAEFEDIYMANQAGYKHATHFYNAMPGFHKRKGYKYEGTVESIYLMEDMTVEMIADGIHVPPTILKLIHKIKGVERTALITDALACAASDSQEAFDPRVIIEDGVCKLADRSALAGSIATMDRLLKTCVQKAEISLEDASRMASETPARIMGVLDRKGTLEKGKDADILALDDDLNLMAVWSMGEIVEGTNKLF